MLDVGVLLSTRYKRSFYQHLIERSLENLYDKTKFKESHYTLIDKFVNILIQKLNVNMLPDLRKHVFQ